MPFFFNKFHLKTFLGHPSTSSHFWHEHFPFRKLRKTVGRRHKGRGFVVSVAFAFSVSREKCGGRESQLNWKRKKPINETSCCRWCSIMFHLEKVFVCNLKMWICHKHLTTINWSQLSPIFWWHWGLGDVDLGSCFLAFKVWQKPTTKHWFQPPKKLQRSKGFRNSFFGGVSKLRKDWNYFQITKLQKPKVLLLGSVKRRSLGTSHFWRFVRRFLAKRNWI